MKQCQMIGSNLAEVQNIPTCSFCNSSFDLGRITISKITSTRLIGSTIQLLAQDS